MQGGRSSKVKMFTDIAAFSFSNLRTSQIAEGNFKFVMLSFFLNDSQFDGRQGLVAAECNTAKTLHRKQILSSFCKLTTAFFWAMWVDVATQEDAVIGRYGAINSSRRSTLKMLQPLPNLTKYLTFCMIASTILSNWRSKSDRRSIASNSLWNTTSMMVSSPSRVLGYFNNRDEVPFCAFKLRETILYLGTRWLSTRLSKT